MLTSHLHTYARWAIVAITTLSASGVSAYPQALERRAINNGVQLRILPLGDSITYGYLSSDGNGYREYLLESLDGNSVEYIGTVQSGDMEDNWNEGHPGAVITEIGTFAEASLPQRPNVVLLMAGTNDVNGGLDVDTAPDRLGALIDQIVSACPDAAVIVAQLTPIANQDSEAAAVNFNNAVPGVVDSRYQAGSHVLVVDMSSKVTTADLADGLHPNDHGYSLMAEVWLAGIQQADSNGWIQNPV